MRGTPPIQRRPITGALRASIVEDLPEINDIKDAELRAKVIEGWAFSLAGSSFERISDMPGEGNPNVMVLKRGDQSVHLRGVAHFATKMVEEFAASHPEIKVDRDIVLAGALCHDIGKPYEFDPVNKKRWAEDPSRAGDPCLRHSVYGAHVCLSVGLPEEIPTSHSGIRWRGSTSASPPSATSCVTPTIPGGTSQARSVCSIPTRSSVSAR